MEEISRIDLSELKLKNCYDSDKDDILNDFYIPVLKNSVKYQRLSGFFNSSALSVSARGIQGLLENSGEMRLICGVVLSKEDIEAIKKGLETPDEVISKFLIDDLKNIESELIKDHVSGLSWLIAKEKLQIKLAILKKNIDSDFLINYGIFHQKVGIFEDKNNNTICFCGSINESATAWKYNIEEFNVFRSWIKEEKKYLDLIYQRFDDYWNGITKKFKIIDIPKAIHKELIKIAPNSIEKINLEKWNKKINYNIKIKEEKKEYKTKQKIKLREYQQKAISKWINNNMRGIFEMATGTGKTFTALGCVEKFLEKTKKNVTIISVPYQHLVQQWNKEFTNFGLNLDRIIADSSNKNWKKEVANNLIDVYLGHKNSISIITTHTTLCSDSFINIIKDNKNINYLLIGDEVHGIGSIERKNGLLDEYKFRLGLSATPKRWFDDIGTEYLFEYFGDVVYEFDLWRAINTVNPSTGKTFLVPYKYIAHYTSLENEELHDYIEKCKAIVKLYGKAKDDKEAQEIFERLLFKRADIIKNANNKYKIFEKLLDDLGKNLNHTLIYCSPQQIEKLKLILKSKKIISHSFTMKEKTKSESKYGGISERENILKRFEMGDYQTLVAMKCLDEGVNIPPAKRAILLASSGNPKEYIQRIGRILRRFENKESAIIYDIIVTPTKSKLPNDLRDFENKIFEKELNRYEEIAKNAINNVEALRDIYRLKNK